MFLDCSVVFWNCQMSILLYMQHITICTNGADISYLVVLIGYVFGKALDERFGRRKQSYPWEQTFRAITDDDDVHFVKRSRRYRNTNYWRRDLCIKQTSGSKRTSWRLWHWTRPQFFFSDRNLNIPEMKRTQSPLFITRLSSFVQETVCQLGCMLLCGQFIVMQWRRIDGMFFVIGN